MKTKKAIANKIVEIYQGYKTMTTQYYNGRTNKFLLNIQTIPNFNLLNISKNARVLKFVDDKLTEYTVDGLTEVVDNFINNLSDDTRLVFCYYFECVYTDDETIVHNLRVFKFLNVIRNGVELEGNNFGQTEQEHLRNLRLVESMLC